MEHVIYNAEHKVLICRKHKVGISPHRVEFHLTTEHNELSLQKRREIREYVATLDLVSPIEVTVIHEKRAPIEGLEILDGCRCNFEGCGEITGTKG